MKNRDKLMQTNLYDLLLKMHKRNSNCILYLLTGKGAEGSCPVEMGEIKIEKEKCDDCIQKWLNQNVDF